MNPPREPLPTLEPGIYRLANPVANPFPKKTKWLSSLHIFPAGEYMCLPASRSFPWRRSVLGARICRKGYRGFICANSRAPFEAIAAKLEYVRPMDKKPAGNQKRGPKPKPCNFPTDQFLDSIAGKELSSNGLKFAAQDFAIGNGCTATHWQIYRKQGLLEKFKARMEYNEFTEAWTYRKNNQLTATV